MTAIERAAFAIWQCWSREKDPQRAEQRWSRLKPMVRDEFIREAKAAARALGVER